MNTKQSDLYDGAEFGLGTIVYTNKERRLFVMRYHNGMYQAMRYYLVCDEVIPNNATDICRTLEDALAMAETI